MICPRNNASEDPIDVLYIFGPGHCGSTLLNLCLDQHSEVLGVSEIVTLNRKKAGWSHDEYVLDSPFWSKVAEQMLEEPEGVELESVPFNLTRLGGREVSAALEANQAAFRAMLTVANKRIVSDASKEPQRLRALLSSPLFRVRVVYLVRDGRAVVHAYRRKYKRWFTGWRKLVRTDFVARHLMSEVPSDTWLTVRYEDLATKPETTLRKICDFMGVSFESAMLKPDSRNFKGVGGNRLRKRPVDGIVLDTAWRDEMKPTAQTFAAVIVSRYNRRYGYLESSEKD